MALLSLLLLALQRGGDNRLSLAQVRGLFDKLIETFPETAGRLGPACTIVQSSHFENAVVKVQSGQEGSLSRLEKEKIKRFLQSTALDEEDTSSDNDKDANWADKVIAQEAKRRKVLKSKYRLEAVRELGGHLFRCNKCAKTYKSPMETQT